MVSMFRPDDERSPVSSDVEAKPTAVAYTAFLTALHGLPTEHSHASGACAWPHEPLTRPRVHSPPARSDGFVRRTLRYLADQGIHQYVTVGTGAPARRAFRDAVRGVDPWARTATVEVATGTLAFGHALGPSRRRDLHSLEDVSHGDRRRDDLPTPSRLRETAEQAGVDLARPLALLLLGTLQHVVHGPAARDGLRQLVGALPTGSYVVVTHVADDPPSPGLRAAVRAYDRAGTPIRPRGRGEVTDLLAELDLVEPGVVLLSTEHPDPSDATGPAPGQVACWGAVARVGRDRAERSASEVTPAP